MTIDLPILYSFRRCPYAMRGRLAIAVSGTPCTMREIVLRNKPASLLDISPKGTVPVLQLADGQIIEESLEIMHWALAQNDPDGWLPEGDEEKAETRRLLEQNDGPFKHHLDRYKYPNRYEDIDPVEQRTAAMTIIHEWAVALEKYGYLINQQPRLADFAIRPFIRQFRIADSDWFDANAPRSVQNWLGEFLDSPLFTRIMQKYVPWEEGDEKITFPPELS